jgi:hypothetical protein
MSRLKCSCVSFGLCFGLGFNAAGGSFCCCCAAFRLDGKGSGFKGVVAGFLRGVDGEEAGECEGAGRRTKGVPRCLRFFGDGEEDDEPGMLSRDASHKGRLRFAGVAGGEDAAREEGGGEDAKDLCAREP